MAASELLLSTDRAEAPTPGTTGLYFYARETAGIAITFEGRVHTPSSGPGSIAHLPHRFVRTVHLRSRGLP